MNDGHNNRYPRKGLPTLAGRWNASLFLESANTERDMEPERPQGLPTEGHRFQVGQNVHMSLGAVHRGKSVACKIVKLLPYEGASYRYRVKSTDEEFERIAGEHVLSPLL
jgi:hypothetical protein